MAKATMKELEELQRIVVRSLTTRIEADIADNIPTDAATLQAAIKLLKDNSVTADPADQDDLLELRKKLSEAAQARTARTSAVGNTLRVVRGDMNGD